MGGPASFLPGSTSSLAEGSRKEFSGETFSFMRKVLRMENFACGERVASSRH